MNNGLHSSNGLHPANQFNIDLISACRVSNVARVKALLQEGQKEVDYENVLALGMNALLRSKGVIWQGPYDNIHRTFAENDVQVITLLLDARANVLYQDETDHNDFPLFLAAAGGHKHACELLLSVHPGEQLRLQARMYIPTTHRRRYTRAGDNLYQGEWDALFAALWMSHVESTRQLAGESLTIPEWHNHLQSRSDIWISSHNGSTDRINTHIELVTLLLNATLQHAPETLRVDYFLHGYTHLFVAYKDHSRILSSVSNVRPLVRALERRGDVFQSFVAFSKPIALVATALVDAKADILTMAPDDHGDIALAFAIHFGHIEVIEALLASRPKEQLRFRIRVGSAWNVVFDHALSFAVWGNSHNDPQWMYAKREEQHVELVAFMLEKVKMYAPELLAYQDFYGYTILFFRPNLHLRYWLSPKIIEMLAKEMSPEQIGIIDHGVDWLQYRNMEYDFGAGQAARQHNRFAQRGEFAVKHIGGHCYGANCLRYFPSCRRPNNLRESANHPYRYQICKILMKHMTYEQVNHRDLEGDTAFFVAMGRTKSQKRVSKSGDRFQLLKAFLESGKVHFNGFYEGKPTHLFEKPKIRPWYLHGNLHKLVEQSQDPETKAGRIRMLELVNDCSDLLVLAESGSYDDIHQLLHKGTPYQIPWSFDGRCENALMIAARAQNVGAARALIQAYLLEAASCVPDFCNLRMTCKVFGGLDAVCVANILAFLCEKDPDDVCISVVGGPRAIDLALSCDNPNMEIIRLLMLVDKFRSDFFTARYGIGGVPGSGVPIDTAERIRKTVANVRTEDSELISMFACFGCFGDSDSKKE